MIYWKLLICIVVNAPLFDCSCFLSVCFTFFFLCRVKLLLLQAYNVSAWLMTEDAQTRIVYFLVQHFHWACSRLPLPFFTHVHLYLFRHFYQNFWISVLIRFVFFLLLLLLCLVYFGCAPQIPDSIECHVPLCVMPKSKNHVRCLCFFSLSTKCRTFFA